MSERFFNCHAHCFTYDHVPEHFLSKWLPISWLLNRKWLRNIKKTVPIFGKFPFLFKVILFFLCFLFGFKKSTAIRYLNFVRYGDRKSQKEIIESMYAYYPKDTGLVMLTMDMEYMGDGKPKVLFQQQLSELALVKNNDFPQSLYPFIFFDPRRYQPIHQREQELANSFSGPIFMTTVKNYLTDKAFQGIKIYPALGYYPFDRRMKEIYDFSLQHEVPILTHCTVGAVHFKYPLDNNELKHPFLKQPLPNESPTEFQQYFTHPLNFECLLNPHLISKYWGTETDYSKLKICLGHWGDSEDWHDYLDNVWRETDTKLSNVPWCSLQLENWIIDKQQRFKNFSWFTIICDLMRRYDNIYADISYTLNDSTLLPLLKMILEADDKIRRRVLFGTDFYLVSKAGSERAFSINVRAALGADLFRQIAFLNAKEFLNNKLSPVIS